MANNLRPVLTKVHPSFPDFLYEIQEERISKGMETRKNKVSKWKLTKTIINFFEANKDIKEMIVRVNI